MVNNTTIVNDSQQWSLMLNDGHWLSTKLKNHMWSPWSTQVNTSQHKSTQVNTSHYVCQRDSWHEWSRQQHLSFPLLHLLLPFRIQRVPSSKALLGGRTQDVISEVFLSFTMFYLFVTTYTYIIYSCILLIWFDFILYYFTLFYTAVYS